MTTSYTSPAYRCDIRGIAPACPAPDIRVSFLIGGTQKGGTSTLDTCLRHHPDLRLGRHKELHYFDNEAHFAAGHDYRVYHQGFDPRPLPGRAAPLLGEATPIYLWWLPAAARIKAYNPAMKWILLLRNPLDRAYSHWNMARLKGKEPLPFMEALQIEAERLTSRQPGQDRVRSYADRGRYGQQLRRLWDVFPREQTLVLASDDLKRDLQGTVDRVCDFLAVTRVSLPSSFQDRNASPYSEPMPEAARRWLLEAFREDIADVERLLGWDCRHWLNSPGA